MSVTIITRIDCEGWDEADVFECAIYCTADNDGDGFYPHDDGWVTVEEATHDEDSGIHYCPKCAAKKGLDDA